MKYLFCTILFICTSTVVFSQNYTRDAGIRVGEGFFVNYRQFYDDDRALEAMAGVSKHGLKVLALREFFRSLTTERFEHIKLMYGYGMHLGVNYTNKYRILNRVYYHDWRWTPQIGFDGIVGFEYIAEELPLIISAAAQPYFEFSLNQYFRIRPFNFVVSFRYRF
ncbi:MAG: hypothetical protein JW894_14160 [Bacteroidales bacterium]|nr:hypothetical protein [Bacteroidales bacterium]